MYIYNFYIYNIYMDMDILCVCTIAYTEIFRYICISHQFQEINSISIN